MQPCDEKASPKWRLPHSRDLLDCEDVNGTSDASAPTE